MTSTYFSFENVHPSWQPCLKLALAQMDSNYLHHLLHTHNWLPGPDKIFNAFSLAVSQVNYLLFGESPYPRPASANGYAFWDAAVTELWSPQGLSKKLNRATSLRNFIKMLFVAEGLLKPPHYNQADIATLVKSFLVQSSTDFFSQFLKAGFLLLNASLVLHPGASNHQVKKDALAWQPFIKQVIHFLLAQRPELQILLFGKVAIRINHLLSTHLIKKICAEHPYNCSFITNPSILAFFKPLHLLRPS
ncbi:MAG TPA: uracil-DNA glycosylase [Gammaproteobacteria bacterium]|nr:uracil-DNA glycosylase [Gammaproteobacteria bacterium]